jgi:dolichol kinase
VVSTVIMLLWVEVVKFCGKTFSLPSWQQRKLLHILTGPIFILTWPLFSDNVTGSIYAATVPAIMTLKFLLVGAGLLEDPDMVNTSSRSGKKEELLKGPVCYGIVFIFSTYLYWKSISGVIYLFILCFGDGMAEVFGRYFGSSNPLPWSPRKSFAGLLGFIISSYFVTYLFIGYYGSFLFHPHPSYETANLTNRLLCDVIIGGLVETLPIADYDNIIVFLTVAIFDNITRGFFFP